MSKSTLKLTFSQHYDLSWSVIDDNYDGAPDAGVQAIAEGVTRFEALQDYIMCFGVKDCDYVISFTDLDSITSVTSKKDN